MPKRATTITNRDVGVVSLDSSLESQVENPGRHELLNYDEQHDDDGEQFEQAASPWPIAPPVPRNLSHRGEVMADCERAGSIFPSYDTPGASLGVRR